MNVLANELGLIWHIFRKDMKLLWPLAVAAAATQWARVLFLVQNVPFEGSQLLNGFVLPLVSLAVLLLMAILIVMVVQQDPLPGIGQDWLARPIRRRDLLAAKLFFVLVAIHVPLMVASLAHGLWSGFAIGESLRTAAVQSLYMLLTFSVPLLAVGALTRNLTEIILGAVAVFFVAVIALVGLVIISPTLTSPLAWVWQTVSLGTFLGGTVAVLSLQYARRLTWVARGIFSATWLVSALLLLLPWQPAFAFQTWLVPASRGALAPSVSFDPAARSRTEPAVPSVQQRPDFVTLLVPLRLTGLPSGAVVRLDRSQLTVEDQTGRTLYSSSGPAGPERELMATAAALGMTPSRDPNASVTQQAAVVVPVAIYGRLRDMPVRLRIRQSLTLLSVRSPPPLPAVGGDQFVLGVGQCASRIDDTGTAIEVGCMAAAQPRCTSVVLVGPQGVQNPRLLLTHTGACPLDYTPWRLSFSLDAFSQSGAKLPFRGPSGRTHYPVDESQLHEARVVFGVYEPLAHFVRDIDVPQIRLRDLAVSTPEVSQAPAAQAPQGQGH